MNSVERVKSLCKEKKIPISKLEKDLGYSNGYISQLRKGVFPSDRLVNIAEYLGVSTEYIMTGKNESKEIVPELTTRDRRDIAKDVKNIMDKLTSGDSGPASYNGEELDPEAADLFRDELEIALRRLKIINKEKYTNKRYKK